MRDGTRKDLAWWGEGAYSKPKGDWGAEGKAAKGGGEGGAAREVRGEPGGRVSSEPNRENVSVRERERLPTSHHPAATVKHPPLGPSVVHCDPDKKHSKESWGFQREWKERTSR